MSSADCVVCSRVVTKRPSPRDYEASAASNSGENFQASAFTILPERESFLNGLAFAPDATCLNRQAHEGLLIGSELYVQRDAGLAPMPGATDKTSPAVAKEATHGRGRGHPTKNQRRTAEGGLCLLTVREAVAGGFG